MLLAKSRSFLASESRNSASLGFTSFSSYADVFFAPRILESRLAALESRPAATPKIGAPAPGLEAKLKQMLGNAESGIRSLLEEYRRSGEEKSAKISQLVTELGQAVEHNRRVSSGGAAELDRRLKAVEVEGGTLEQIAAALEHAVSDLKKQVGEGAAQTFAPLRKELEAQKSRVGAIEELMRHPDVSALNSVSLSVSLLEGRLKNLESGLANELKERFSILDSAFGDVSRKAGLTQETAAGSARRVEKLEEQAARLPYLENRLNSGEAKLGKIYELEALGQSLRVSVEGMEKNFSAAMRESAFISSEHKKTCSDLESLSQQVKHLAALFNQLRTELAFLMPRRQESPGG